MPARDAQAEVQKLFLSNSSMIRGFIIGLMPDFGAADDVLHEVFLAVTEKAAEYTPGTDFLAWARAFARNKVQEHVRSRRRGHKTLDPEVLELLADAAPADVDRFAAHRSALAGCLEEVRGRSRDVLRLRYCEGLAPGDIARRISWKVGPVNVALSRARRFLRDCARRRLAAGEGN
jgi:RNA polymerase sigma-70 factor (ECF subfamily)